MKTTSHYLSNAFLFISTFPFNILSPNFLNICLKLIFLEIFITNGDFFSLQGLRKLREAAELKCYAASLEQEGLKEVELAMDSTPVSELVDLMSAGVHKTGG